jgi:hypothetical protein
LGTSGNYDVSVDISNLNLYEAYES